DYNQIVTWQGLCDSVALHAATMPACLIGSAETDKAARNAFVMYGDIRKELKKEETNALSFVLQRLVARIDITNEAYAAGTIPANAATGPENSFFLTSARLLHAQPAAFVVPKPDVTPDVVTTSDWAPITGIGTEILYGKPTTKTVDVDPTQEPEAVPVTTADDAKAATLQYAWHTLYTYPNSDTEHAPTALEIKGTFRGTEITRQIPFVDKEGNAFPVEGNHRYLVRIVKAPGQTDIAFNIAVSEWDAVDTVNVKPDQTEVPEIANIGGNGTPNLISDVAKTYDVYYTQDGEITFEATCPFAPGVRVKYYDSHTDSWTTKGDWLKVEQVGSTEIVTKADHSYKNSFQVTFNKFDGGVTRKAMLLVHNGGSEVECDTILVRHVVTYPGTDFEPEAVETRDDGSDIIVAPVNVGATKIADELKMIGNNGTAEGYEAHFEKVGYYFQWGRKTGIKYMGKSVTKGIPGPILIEEENSEEYQNKFIFFDDNPEYGSWSSDSDPTLWNAGTEDIPVKGRNDPCPPGWRVITKKELDKIKDKVVVKKVSSDVYSATIKNSNIKLDFASKLMMDSGMQVFSGQVLSWFTSLPETNEKVILVEISEAGFSDESFGKTAAAPVRCIQEQTPTL
ncbi:hypothetical protein AALM74_27305, partial [Parabacteroides segnis]|uniref:hypothetical protein n=1 Tax=Parabacteroides segnis TaxID=2763058 RepID=UPI00351139FC